MSLASKIREDDRAHGRSADAHEVPAERSLPPNKHHRNDAGVGQGQAPVEQPVRRHPRKKQRGAEEERDT
eukprot:12934672-Prorocentrum_lima.AAC.1